MKYTKILKFVWNNVNFFICESFDNCLIESIKSHIENVTAKNPSKESEGYISPISITRSRTKKLYFDEKFLRTTQRDHGQLVKKPCSLISILYHQHTRARAHWNSFLLLRAGYDGMKMTKGLFGKDAVWRETARVIRGGGWRLFYPLSLFHSVPSRFAPDPANESSLQAGRQWPRYRGGRKDARASGKLANAQFFLEPSEPRVISREGT